MGAAPASALQTEMQMYQGNSGMGICDNSTRIALRGFVGYILCKGSRYECNNNCVLAPSQSLSYCGIGAVGWRVCASRSSRWNALHARTNRRSFASGSSLAWMACFMIAPADTPRSHRGTLRNRTLLAVLRCCTLLPGY
jgi:hypothetical protein